MAASTGADGASVLGRLGDARRGLSLQAKRQKPNVNGVPEIPKGYGSIDGGARQRGVARTPNTMRDTAAPGFSGRNTVFPRMSMPRYLPPAAGFVMSRLNT